MTTRVLFLLALLGLPAGAVAHGRSPVSVHWASPTLDKGVLKLTARIEHHTPLPVALSIRVAVPPGVQLVEGKAQFDLPASSPAGTENVAYTFTVQGTPAQDLVLAADATTSSFGIHAKDAYRFGRSVPAQPRPSATGPTPKVGRLHLGPSVPAGAHSDGK